MESGEHVLAQVRQALAESDAVIAVVGKESMNSAWVALEVGAAMAWQKPAYLLTHDILASALPKYLQSFQAFAIQELHRVIRAIRDAKQPLSETELEWLKNWYKQTSVPLDQMVMEASTLESMAKAFRSEWKRAIPPERILKELFRLRKKGNLPRIRRAQNPQD